MEFVVKEVKSIADGEHVGVVVDVEERTEPFHYVDVHIEFDGITSKAGYPATVSEKSSFGKLLQRFGTELKVNEPIDPQPILVGKKVAFETMTDEKGFAKIKVESVRPAIEDKAKLVDDLYSREEDDDE